MKLKISAILILFFCFSWPLFGYEQSSLPFFVLGKKINLTTPLIREKNYFLVPASDFLPKLGFELSWNSEKKELRALRKTDQWKMVFRAGSSIIFSRNTSYRAPVACRVYQSNFYIPAGFTSWLIGARLSANKEKISVSAKLLEIDLKKTASTPVVEAPAKIEEPKLAKQAAQGPRMFAARLEKKERTGVRVLFEKINTSMPDYRDFWLPEIKEGELVLEVLGREIPLKTPIFENEELMVPLDEFLASFPDAKIVKLDKKIGFYWENYSVEAEIDSDIVDVGSERHRLPVEIKEINQKIYAPLRPLAQFLDLGVYFDRPSAKIYVNPRLFGLRIEEFANQKQARLFFSAEDLKLESGFLENPIRLFLDFKNVILDVDLKQIKLKDPDILGIKCSQFEPDTTRLVFELAETKTYAVLQIPENKEIDVSFVPWLEKIEVAGKPDSTEIALKISSRVIPKIFVLKNPERLIIDLPGFLFKTDNLIEVAKGPIFRIRGSQFKVDPLTTRLVVDLAQEVSYETRFEPEENKFYVAVKPEKVVETSREIKKKYSALRGKTIVIDPGHGGGDPGAIVKGIYEKNLTLPAAQIVARLINESGGTCLLCLEEDNSMSLAERVNFAEANNAAVFISFHYNASILKHMEGSETYYYKPIDYSLAAEIHKAILRKLKRKDNFIRKAKFYVLVHSKMPTVLIEPIYLTNAEEFKLIQEKDFQEKIAEAILTGLVNYFEKGRK